MRTDDQIAGEIMREVVQLSGEIGHEPDGKDNNSDDK